MLKLFKIEGADAWFEKPSSFSRFKIRSDDCDAVTDIADVWFDSGSTHSFVLEERDDLFWPVHYILKEQINIGDGFTLLY